jgi:hypothetical protein
MQPLFDDVTFEVGTPAQLAAMRTQPARALFSEATIAFLDDFSRYLLQHPDARGWPDVATLAFWCRRRALEREKQRYLDLPTRLGRGLAFHITPGNVATSFAWSLTAGLLSGNSNLVRLPSRAFPQAALICEALNQVLQHHPGMAPYLCLVRYPPDRRLNDLFSSWCQTRLIWGGDNTIVTLRQSPLPPRSLDLAFADRYSLALIDADRYLAIADKAAVAASFYNDTYLLDQNACTSPRLVVWLGDRQRIAQARGLFWCELETLAAARYPLQPMVALNKFSRFCQHSARSGQLKQASSANLVFRAELSQLDGETLAQREAGGYFLEYLASALEEILPVCGSGCQTLAVLGVDRDAIQQFLAAHRPAGIDRVVPLGQTLAFSLRWDGFDLISALSRCITFAL